MRRQSLETPQSDVCVEQLRANARVIHIQFPASRLATLAYYAVVGYFASCMARTTRCATSAQVG